MYKVEQKYNKIHNVKRVVEEKTKSKNNSNITQRSRNEMEIKTNKNKVEITYESKQNLKKIELKQR